MKTIFKLFCYISIFIINLYSQQQNYFPISIGNEYQFIGRNFQEYYFGKIEKDTIYPNLKKYFITPYFFEFGNCRVDSNGNVLSISRPFFLAEPPEEYLIFKADAILDEVWVICDSINPLRYKGYGKCIYADSGFVFGKMRMIKGVLIYSDSYYYYYYWLAEGIGLIRNQYDDGSGLDLNYAKIDGKIYGTLVSVENETLTFPEEFNVSQNYPNPFNCITNIKVILPTQFTGEKIKLSVYNLLGSKVYEENYIVTGSSTISLNTEHLNLSSGAYFYSVSYDTKIITKKFLLLK